MRYDDIIKQLAEKENLSTEEIEKEMEAALLYSGIGCTVREFLEITSAIIKTKDYI